MAEGAGKQESQLVAPATSSVWEPPHGKAFDRKAFDRKGREEHPQSSQRGAEADTKPPHVVAVLHARRDVEQILKTRR